VRIVAAADRSRRHLERNLHDGAQSQLVTLALALRVGALTRSEPGSARLAEVEAEVVTALAELRSIARGLYPRELADEGLVSALETLADLDPTPLELDLDLPVPGPRQVESAAYYVAGAVLTTSAHDPTAHRRLRARLRDRRLELDLQGGSAFDLESIRDRVGAVDGTVERLAADRVRIELPCGS
jgi:signal transduction histidine kinase